MERKVDQREPRVIWKRKEQRLVDSGRQDLQLDPGGAGYRHRSGKQPQNERLDFLDVVNDYG